MEKRKSRTECRGGRRGKAGSEGVAAFNLKYRKVLVCLGCHNKYYRLSGLNNRSLFSHSSRGTKSKIRFQPLQYVVRAFFLACRMSPSRYVLIQPFLSMCTRRERTSFLASLLKRTLILSDQGPTLVTSYSINYFLTQILSHCICVRASTYEFWRDTYIQSVRGGQCRLH